MKPNISFCIISILTVFAAAGLALAPGCGPDAGKPAPAKASASDNVLPSMDGVYLNEISFKGHDYLIGHKLYGMAIVHAASCRCLSNHPTATVLEQPTFHGTPAP